MRRRPGIWQPGSLQQAHTGFNHRMVVTAMASVTATDHLHASKKELSCGEYDLEI